MAVRRTNCYEQALACDQFDKFCVANNLKDILQQYQNLCRTCTLSATNFSEFYPKIKSKVPSWKASELWTKLDKRASHPSYGGGKFCSETRVLIIGGGPCGLRAAIESQLLGAKTVLIEKRINYTRNNVVHLWPFVISDLRNLGAKTFYGKFCAGSIDHISIRQLQCILLKIALLVGVQVEVGVAFESLIEPEDDVGWKAAVLPSDHPVSHFIFDVVIGADGRRSTLVQQHFQRKALRAKLAIAITANFVHNHTEAEAKVQEISGISYIFKQKFFQELDEAMGIALENIVYYKDETHYFVMTPTKQSLLEKGVLYQDFADPEQLLSPENIDFEALQQFTMQAVVFSTDNQLENLEYVINSRGEPDICLFDFTTMYASENSCRAIQRKSHNLLLALVGDSLLEPFWPTGTGISRGFLAAFDAAWMIRSVGKGSQSVFQILAERESVHRTLAQTTHENLFKDHNLYSIDPTTRYPKINLRSVGAHQVKNLVDSDEEITDVSLSMRDSKQCQLVSETLILQWFQAQLSQLGITIHSISDVFTNGDALMAIIQRYRNDLVNYALRHSDCPGSLGMNNQCAFEILNDEFNIPPIINGENSMKMTEIHLPHVIPYLSQIYNVFKREIPKPTEVEQCNPNLESDNNERAPSYPNNSAFHHTLSIKQFLEGKEQLQKKKIEDEAEFKQRSQIYESIMQTEKNNQQRSTSIVNVPVAKINPVSASDLFSACRNGSDREKCSKPKMPADTMAMIKLARSRSDVGYKSRQFGGVRNSSPLSPPPICEEPKRSELEEMQLRIRKSKATPLGNIVSVFLGKHIQNSGCLSNEESDENPLSSERRRLLRQTRPRSAYQNLNDQSTAYYQEDQENMDDEEHQQQSTNPFFNNPEQDPGFKERCKFLEKNLYNSGRDIKVHIGAAWFQKADSESKKKSNLPSAAGSLQKLQSSGLTTGFHPLKRGSSVEYVMGESFNSIKKNGDNAEKEFNPKASFLERRLAEMAATRHPEWRSDEKITSPKAKNDHNSHHFQLSQRQQSGTVACSPDLKTEQNNKEKSQKEKKPSNAANDSDLDGFLNAIDFNGIDSQDLQELLSSY